MVERDTDRCGRLVETLCTTEVVDVILKWCAAVMLDTEAAAPDGTVPWLTVRTEPKTLDQVCEPTVSQ